MSDTNYWPPEYGDSLEDYQRIMHEKLWGPEGTDGCIKGWNNDPFLHSAVDNKRSDDIYQKTLDGIKELDKIKEATKEPLKTQETEPSKESKQQNSYPLKVNLEEYLRKYQESMTIKPLDTAATVDMWFEENSKIYHTTKELFDALLNAMLDSKRSRKILRGLIDKNKELVNKPLNVPGLEPVDMTIKTTEEMKEFPSGAKKSDRANKGRFDLISYTALLRLAQHLEKGAAIYGANNWRKGIPLTQFLDSAARHLYQLIDGMTDEDHAAAVLFNVMGFIETQHKICKGELPNELDNWKNNDS